MFGKLKSVMGVGKSRRRDAGPSTQESRVDPGENQNQNPDVPLFELSPDDSSEQDQFWRRQRRSVSVRQPDFVPVPLIDPQQHPNFTVLAQQVPAFSSPSVNYSPGVINLVSLEPSRSRVIGSNSQSRTGGDNEEERQIYVSRLHERVTQYDLRAAFEAIGEVIIVTFLAHTNRNFGSAILRFAHKEVATRALQEMQNFKFFGQSCSIYPVKDVCSLYLGHINHSWTKEDMETCLARHNINNYVSLTLMPNHRSPDLNRGFGYLQFSCHSDATEAFHYCVDHRIYFGHHDGDRGKVEYADPPQILDPNIAQTLTKVIIDQLPYDYFKHQNGYYLHQALLRYGQVKTVELAINMHNPKRTNYAFVDFATHENAVACVEGLKNDGLGYDKSQVRARLLDPIPNNIVARDQHVTDRRNQLHRLRSRSLRDFGRHGGW